MLKEYSNQMGERFLNYSPTNEMGVQGHERFREALQKIQSCIFITGFPKTASTTLTSILYLHPHICLPLRKEPFFYPTDEYRFGMDFYWKKYFPHHVSHSHICEASTANSFLPYVPRRIHDTIPSEKVKLIFSIRNPIDRAYSNWLMYKRNGEETLSFEQCVEWEMHELEKGTLNLEDEEYWKYHQKRLTTEDYFIRRRTLRTYLSRSLYATHIKRYLKFFPRESIFVVQQEELREDRQAVIHEMCKFIGVNPELIDTTVRSDYHVGNNSILTVHLSGLKYKTRKYAPEPLQKILQKGYKALSKRMPQARMKSKTRAKLQEFYRTENKALEDLLGIDLSHWYQTSHY